ncbi:MAG: cupin domain-containing protein [Acidobacteriota bacterium]
MSAPILNIEKLSFQKWSRGNELRAEIGWASNQLGSKKLGFNVTVVPPGKSAFPHHAHFGNEEMFFILAGEGSVRIGDGSHKIRTGDFISLPPGRKGAHQIINDSNAPLKYLAVSTMEIPEVVEYPDSGKLGVLAGAAPGRAASGDAIRHFTRVQDGVDYWDGEK